MPISVAAQIATSYHSGMVNDISITDDIARLSPARKDWLRSRSAALVNGVFRAVGMPSEVGTHRLVNEFARIHNLSIGEKHIAEDAIISVLVKLEKKGHRSEPYRG